MRKLLLLSPRRFTVWEYYVSHGQLLIRSAWGQEDNVNIDILFHGVEYVSLPGMQGMGPGIELYEGDFSDFNNIKNIFPDPSNESRIFFLCSNQREFIVVAHWVKISENQWEWRISGLER